MLHLLIQLIQLTYTTYVSLVSCDEARKVTILRDTGASQSLILDSVLPFGGKSSTGTMQCGVARHGRRVHGSSPSYSRSAVRPSFWKS